MSVGTLLTILGFLSGRAAAVSPSNILLLLGLGLHLAIVLRLVTASSEADAVFEDMLKIVHCFYLFTVYSLRFTVDYSASKHFICKL